MEWLIPSITILVGLIIFLLMGMPVAFAIGATSALGIAVFLGPKNLAAVANIAWSASNNFTLTAVPLFILMAEVLIYTGIGSDLFGAMEKWFGKIPGGLAVGTIIASAIFGAVSGTAIGVAAIIGGVAIPEMRAKKYAPKIACGTVAAASGLGMLIPPSVPMISYGVITETSVGDLFLAGLVPGIVLCGLFIIYTVIVSGKQSEVSYKRYTMKEKLLSLRSLIPVVILIVLVIGSIYGGYATCTEAAGVGAFGAIVLTALMGRLKPKDFLTALKKACMTSATVVIIMICAQIFSYLLTALHLPQLLSQWVISIGLNRWVVFAIIHIAYIFLGMFFDCGSIFLLTMPVLFPIVMALGFNPYWFAATCVVNFCIAVITPPVGLAAYVVKGLAPDVSLQEIMKGAFPYVIIDIAMIVLLCIFPQISLCLLK